MLAVQTTTTMSAVFALLAVVLTLSSQPMPVMSANNSSSGAARSLLFLRYVGRGDNSQIQQRADSEGDEEIIQASSSCTPSAVFAAAGMCAGSSHVHMIGSLSDTEDAVILQSCCDRLRALNRNRCFCDSNVVSLLGEDFLNNVLVARAESVCAAPLDVIPCDPTMDLESEEEDAAVNDTSSLAILQTTTTTPAAAPTVEKQLVWPFVPPTQVQVPDWRERFNYLLNPPTSPPVSSANEQIDDGSMSMGLGSTVDDGSM